MTPHFWPKNDKNAQGSTSRKIGWGCVARFLKPLPYFRPKSVIFPTLFQTWSKIWYPISDLKPWSPARDRSAWLKRETVLSPNDEEVANSSKKHIQFKTRVHKPYPISDQNGWNWYPFSDQQLQRNIPFVAAHTHIAYIRNPSPTPPPLPGRKTRCRLWVSLFMQARLTRVLWNCEYMKNVSCLVPRFCWWNTCRIMQYWSTFTD